MDSLIYAGFVVVGAVTLLIEAYRNFNAPGNAHPFVLHPILKKVEIRNLTTPGEATVGFAIYAAFYLAVYAVVLGSAEIFQLILQANQSMAEVGAIGTALQPDEAPFSLSGSGYEKPLLVSAALIAFLSLGAVRPVEATLRGVAHSLAGIPGGVYKVITELQNFDFIGATTGYPTPLASRFNAEAAGLVAEGEYLSLRAEIERSLTAIDCLTEATSPARSRLYFPLFYLATLTNLSQELDAEVAELGATIDAMSERKAAGEEPAAILQSVAQAVATARQNTMAVFAVLYVRNNRSVFLSTKPFRRPASGEAALPEDMGGIMPIEAVRRAIARRYNAELNSFTMALLLATVIGAATIFWTYQSWWDRNARSAAPHSELAWLVCLDQKAATDLADSAPCPPHDAAKVTERNVGAFLLKLRPAMASQTFWETFRSSALVLACVFFVLIGRESRIDEQSWPSGWTFRQFPFLTLLGMAFFPGLIAVVVVACTALLEQGFYTGWQLKSAQVTELFLTQWVYFVMHFGTGLVLGFGTLVIMDKHNAASWRWFVTALVALAFAAVSACWTWCILFFTQAGNEFYYLVPDNQPFPQLTRDTLILTVIPSVFFLFFALFMEISEPSRPRPQAPARAAAPSEQPLLLRREGEG